MGIQIQQFKTIIQDIDDNNGQLFGLDIVVLAIQD